uniref:Uncharacterized protein n=1 Tax=Anguilla anguilla TaxID=7936 RepID=A0A0E9T0C4_ANGAN
MDSCQITQCTQYFKLMIITAQQLQSNITSLIMLHFKCEQCKHHMKNFYHKMML